MKIVTSKLSAIYVSVFSVCLSLFATPVFGFEASFTISSDKLLTFEVIASYVPTSGSSEYSFCRSLNFSRKLNVKRIGNNIVVKDSVPLVSRRGNCSASFSSINVMLKNEANDTEMVSFIDGAGSAPVPQKVEVSCLNGAVRRKNPSWQSEEAWVNSYFDFDCHSSQSTDSVATVFSFDPEEPFKLKEIVVSYVVERVPEFSTVIATERHGPVEFLFSKNNWGLAGAFSPVIVSGFPELEGIGFITTSVFYKAKGKLPYIEAKSLDGKGPSFAIDNADVYDGCKSDRLLRVWPSSGFPQKVHCLE